MAIPAQDPWNSSHLEHPRESCEPVKAGQRRKCHIIELSDRLRIAGCHVHGFAWTCMKHQERTSQTGRSIQARMPTQSR